jgi:KDEL-tailed cysteine endopeptidase
MVCPLFVSLNIVIGLCDFVCAAFKWIIQNKGIGSEASYPYTGVDGTCKTVPTVATLSKFTDVTAGSEAALGAALNSQPISIAIQANQIGFQFYQSGVFNGP